MNPLEAMAVCQALHEERQADAELTRRHREARSRMAHTHTALHSRHDPHGRHGWWGDVVALLHAWAPHHRHPRVPQHRWAARPQQPEHRTHPARNVG